MIYYYPDVLVIRQTLVYDKSIGNHTQTSFLKLYLSGILGLTHELPQRHNCIEATQNWKSNILKEYTNEESNILFVGC